MRGITVAVVLAGILTYTSGYAPPATPDEGPAFNQYVISPAPLQAEPDNDEDEGRVNPRRKQ